jgi:hypothetical protein
MIMDKIYGIGLFDYLEALVELFIEMLVVLVLKLKVILGRRQFIICLLEK